MNRCKMLVLDTHVWVWLVNGDERIKKAGFLPHINRAVKGDGIVISAISTWEVAMLVAKERLILSENVLDWIRNASSAPGMSISPLSPEVACESTRLPGEFHGDPADRIIAATARVLNATLLTFDRAKVEYAKKGYINILDPRV